MLTKTCSKCRLELSLDCFYAAKKEKSGLASHCKTCQKDKYRQYYERNKERIDAKNKQWARENPGLILEASKRWQKAHRSHMTANTRRWRAQNPEASRRINQKRRAYKKSNGTFLVLKKEMLKLVTSPCCLCGAKGNIHIDHIIPLSRGGRHAIGNLQPLCASCNLSKSNKFLVEFKKLQRVLTGSTPPL